MEMRLIFLAGYLAGANAERDLTHEHIQHQFEELKGDRLESVRDMLVNALEALELGDLLAPRKGNCASAGDDRFSDAWTQRHMYLAEAAGELLREAKIESDIAEWEEAKGQAKAEADLSSPPVTMDEQHRLAWADKHGRRTD